MQFKVNEIPYLIASALFLLSTASHAESKEVNITEDQNKCGFEVPQEGRSEPQYKGLSGFLVFSNSDRIYDPYEALPKYPWEVTSLKQVGPKKWKRKGKKFKSKTPVTVVSQELKHRNHGFYSGTLTVKIDKTNEEIKIFPNNFTPAKYWKCSPQQAVKHSFYIAKIINPDAKAVSKKGEWEDIGKEKRLFCTETDNWDSEPNVRCFLYKKYKYGYGGVQFKFKPDDLEIVY